MFESTKKGLLELQSSVVKTPSYAQRYQPRVSVRIENTPLERPNYVPMPKVNIQPNSEDFSGMFGAFREARKYPEHFLPEDWNKATFGEKFGAVAAESIHNAPAMTDKILRGAVSDFGQGFVDTQKLPAIAANKLGIISDESRNAWENMIQKERRGVKLTVDELVAGIASSHATYQPGEEPKTAGEKVVSGIAHGIGTALSIGKITKGIQGMAATPNLLKFVSQYPKLFNWFSMTAATVIYGQADVRQMSEFQSRLHTVGRDTIAGTIFSMAGNIKNTLKAIPGVGIISAGLAYLEGARGEDVIVAGIVGSVMEGTFRVGRFRDPDTVLRNAAEKTINEYGGEVTKNTTPREMEMVYQKILKENPKAEDRVKIDRAYQFLSDTKPTQTPDEANTMKGAIERVVSMVKGERQGNTFTGSPVDARQIARIKPEEVPTPADLYARILEMKLSPETTARVKEYINAEKVNEMIATGKENLDINSFDKLKYQEHKQRIDDAMAEVSFYLETAKAGERIAIPSDAPGENYTFMGVKSSFPDWVPSELRTRKLFDKVQESLYNSEVPTKGKAKELYDVVMNRVREKAGVDIENVKEAEYVFNKLEEASAWQSTADELRGYIQNRFHEPEPVKMKISELSKRAETSIENGGNPKPGRVEVAKKNIQNGERRPVEIRYVDGKMVIEDGHHRIQAAKELGIEDYPIVDVTKRYAEPTPFEQLMESPRFQEILKTDKEFQNYVDGIKEANQEIDKILNELQYVEAKQGQGAEGAIGSNPDRGTSAKENAGRENTVQKSDAQNPEGRGKGEKGDSRSSQGEAESQKKALGLKTHREVAKKFEELVNDADNGKVRDNSVRLFKDIANSIAEGRIQPEGAVRIVEDMILKDDRLSVTDFVDAYKKDVSDSARVLNILSQTQRRLKKSFLAKLDEKIEIARKNNDLFTVEKLTKERAKLEKNIPDVEPNNWEKFRDGFKTIDDIRRGLLVTQIATTSRNVVSQTIRTAFMLFEDVGVATAEAAIGKRTAREAYRRIAYDAMAVAHRFTKSGRKTVNDYLSANPYAAEKLYNKIYGEQEAVVGSTLKESVEKGIETLNTLNRAQEYFFRNLVFEARVGLALERAGLTTKDINKLPPKELDAAINDALEITFSKVPQSNTFGGAVMSTYQKLPFLTLIHSFPRYWANATKFLLEYNATGFLKFTTKKNREALARGDYEAYRSVARAVTGTLMLSAAIALRESDNGGDKWYELKVGGKTIDLRPFAPFSSYLYLAEVIRYMGGRKTNIGGMDFLQGVIGINRIAGTGLAIIDLFQSDDWDGFLNGTNKILGSWFSGFTVPFRVLGDFVAGFSDEESILRYQRSSHPFNNLVNPTMNNLPFIRQYLPKYPDLTSDRFLENEHPWVRQLTGINLMTKTWLAGEIDRLAIPYQSIYPNTGEKKLDLYIMEEMGKILQVQGPSLEKDPAYLSGSDFYKKNAVLDMISESKQVAKMRAMRKHNDDFVEFERKKALDKQGEMGQ